MTELLSLVPVRQTDMAVGQPLRWPVYDWHGNLLLAAGVVVENESQLNGLIQNGFIHDSRWDTNRGKSAPVVKRPDKKNRDTPLQTENQPPPTEVVMAMDDARWAVGETLYLQLFDNPAIRYTVRLIGFVKNKTILVTAPVIDGKLEFIRDGQTFVVRAFSGKKAYAFTAAAVKSVHTPHPYLHLSYPKQMRCTVVRRGVRAQVRIIASASLGNPERMAAAIMIDLSTGGASALIKEPLGEKDDVGRFKFKVHVAENDEYLNLKVVLRSISPSDNDDGFKHGFEFVDVSIHERLILSAFVHQTLAEADH